MAQKEGEWPRGQADGSERGGPTASFQTRDGVFQSGRSVAELRSGTAPGVGPKGGSGNGSSDMGQDRLSPRGFDPIGTDLNRTGPQEASERVRRR
jgi:hypothetical protein